jgi:hypothetical protein
MKTKMFRFRILILILALCGPGTFAAHGQTLAQVLTAIQKRNRLVQERENVNIDLANASMYSFYWTPLVHKTIQLIQWAGVGDSPNEGNVNALAVNDQVKLLDQAWTETEKLQGYFVDPRKFASGVGMVDYMQCDEERPVINKETFPRVLTMLARKLSSINTLLWPLSWEYTFFDTNEPSASMPTSPPATFTHFDVTGNVNFSCTSVSSSGGIAMAVGYGENGGQARSDGICGFPYKTVGKAPGSFPGDIQVFTNFSYVVNQISDLTWPSDSGGDGTAQTLYHSSQQRALDTEVDAGATTDLNLPRLFAGDVSQLSLQGNLIKHTEDNGTIIEDFIPNLPNQTSTLRNSIFDLSPDDQPPSWDLLDYFVGGLWGVARGGPSLHLITLFKAKFADGFSYPTQSPPEKPPLLRLEPDFAHGRLNLQLANSPTHECELIWQFPECIQTPTQYWKGSSGSISARCILQARGVGDWDAVYSGKPEDRESELQWNGTWDTKNDCWPTFESYLREFWRPVLKQLVCATYGVNVTQKDRYTYQIDFFRRDQVSQDKDKNTGEYTFPTTGAVDTFLVSNPKGDDAQAGYLEIVVHKGQRNEATYDVTLSQNLDSDQNVTESDWSYTGPSINKMVTVTPAVVTLDWSSENYQITQKKTVVDTTTLDGVAQPKVTTTYWEWAPDYNPTLIYSQSWDWLFLSKGVDDTLESWSGFFAPPDERIEKVVEEGSDGIRTTTYTYHWDDQTMPLPPQDGYGNNLTYHGIDYLMKIEQTGGPNPYTANYDSAGQLTSYSDKWGSETVAYSGQIVTRTQKINGQPVRTLVTTYSGDMSTATTTAQ